MLDLAPLLAPLTIQTKRATYSKLDISSNSEFAWAQRKFVHEIERQYNLGLPVRIIVLKARQLGISTATAGVLFNWAFIHPGSNELVVSHEKDHAEQLFQKTKLFWDTWPFRHYFAKPKYSTRQEITWQETYSNIRIATAKNAQIGRGGTYQACHLSECAVYPDPDSLETGLNQAIPYEHGTIVVLESTANGSGNWWNRSWDAAIEGESEYTPLFFDWFSHFEYQMQTPICTRLELTPYERKLLDMGASYENVAWRRWKIRQFKGDERKFQQEYPATPEEAFLSTGQHIFSRAKINEAYDEFVRTSSGPRNGVKGFIAADGRFVSDPDGSLTVFRAPIRDARIDRYFVGGDPSETVEGDRACMQVINRQTLEQVAVWHGQIHPVEFAREMMKLGRYYNDAMLCPEVEGGGYAAIGVLMESGYPSIWQHRWADAAPGKVALKFGWSTNIQRKQWCIGHLQGLLNDNSITIHDPRTRNQLFNYVIRDDGSWGNSSDEDGDDAVMALAITYLTSHLEGPFEEIKERDPLEVLMEQEYGGYDDLFSGQVA